MKSFQIDATVQYGIFLKTGSYKNPLLTDDYQFSSPYNTYLYAGLPPAPIANPSLEALQSIAFPVETTYYYFRAKCDGSGYHEFSETFEEHLGNGCQ